MSDIDYATAIRELAQRQADLRALDPKPEPGFLDAYVRARQGAMTRYLGAAYLKPELRMLGWRMADQLLANTLHRSPGLEALEAIWRLGGQEKLDAYVAEVFPTLDPFADEYTAREIKEKLAR